MEDVDVFFVLGRKKVLEELIFEFKYSLLQFRLDTNVMADKIIGLVCPSATLVNQIFLGNVEFNVH